MTLGFVTPAMRLWCRRLYRGATWYRTREYAYKTYCDRYHTPHYALVERMRDVGLVVFVRGNVHKGYVWEAKLTELGLGIGRSPPNSHVRRLMLRGEEDDAREE